VSDIFREIDEDLRREQFGKLWQRYGKYVIILAVVVVAASAIFVGWREYQLRQRQAAGVRFAAAADLARQGKDKDAADAFAAVAHDASGGRAVLARFEQAALLAKTSDPTAGIAIYDEIAHDTGVAPIYRDLANLLAARFALDAGDPKAVIERLKPLIDPSNAWHPSALELTALAQLKAGDKAAARTTYQQLADDLTAPQGLRARAAEMVAALGP
jgi:hypothetical protein